MCGLLGGCAEGIVFERLVGLRRPLHTVCNDLIGDLLRFGDVCCLRAVSLLECSMRVSGKAETNFIFVSFDDSRFVRGGRSDGRGPEIRLIGKCIGTRAIVGLGDSLCLIRPVGLFSQYLKAIGVDATARDRALAVDGIVDCVVVLLCRSECFLQDIANVLITYVVLRTVARIHILAKGIPRAASEGTMRRSCRQHRRMLRLQCSRRNTVTREDGRSNGVARRRACKPRDVALRIDSSAVIDLVHRPHSDGDGAGRNRAHIASRDCRTIRNRRRIRRLVKGIVIHLVARAAVKLRRVGHRLRRGSFLRIIPCDIRRCVHRRRGVRACLARDKA